MEILYWIILGGIGGFMVHLAGYGKKGLTRSIILGIVVVVITGFIMNAIRPSGIIIADSAKLLSFLTVLLGEAALIGIIRVVKTVWSKN